MNIFFIYERTVVVVVVKKTSDTQYIILIPHRFIHFVVSNSLFIGYLFCILFVSSSHHQPLLKFKLTGILFNKNRVFGARCTYYILKWAKKRYTTQNSIEFWILGTRGEQHAHEFLNILYGLQLLWYPISSLPAIVCAHHITGCYQCLLLEISTWKYAEMKFVWIFN